jgi:hypothetical protein
MHSTEAVERNKWIDDCRLQVKALLCTPYLIPSKATLPLPLHHALWSDAQLMQ